MLNFIFGPAATGKTTATYKKIEDEVEKLWNDITDFIVNHPSFYHVP
mgnify:CR=1 FL=1